MQAEFETEREAILNDLRLANREVALRDQARGHALRALAPAPRAPFHPRAQLLQIFVPGGELERVYRQAQYDEASDTW